MTRIPADLQSAIALFTSSLGGSSIPTCEEAENRIPGDYTWESITLNLKNPNITFLKSSKLSQLAASESESSRHPEPYTLNSSWSRLSFMSISHQPNNWDQNTSSLCNSSSVHRLPILSATILFSFYEIQPLQLEILVHVTQLWVTKVGKRSTSPTSVRLYSSSSVTVCCPIGIGFSATAKHLSVSFCP
jgi:hypothetical protein